MYKTVDIDQSPARGLALVNLARHQTPEGGTLGLSTPLGVLKPRGPPVVGLAESRAAANARCCCAMLW